MKTPHTATNRGKRVRIVLKDGTKLDDRFVDDTDRHVLLERVGKVRKRDIKAFIVLKGPSRG